MGISALGFSWILFLGTTWGWGWALFGELINAIFWLVKTDDKRDIIKEWIAKADTLDEAGVSLLVSMIQESEWDQSKRVDLYERILKKRTSHPLRQSI